MVESVGAEEVVETAAPVEGTVQEPAIPEVDVAPTDTVETPPVLEAFDAPAAEAPAPSEAVELVQEEQEPTPADELELIEDMLEPTAETVVADSESGEEETVAPMAIEPIGSRLEHEGLEPAATTDESGDESSPADDSESEITGASVEHDVPLELSPDAGEGPPPEGIVGAEVDRPEPIELAGGPGMVVGSDQAAELVGSGESSSEDLEAGDRSPLETEQPPIELEEPIPVEALEPEPLEAAAPAVSEDTPATPTQDPEAAPTQDPEPLVTETMAEVYVRQGLVDEALNVYRSLLARRPADTELLGRIAELESRAAPAASASDDRPRYRASETGGRSTRTFLAQVLAAGAGEEASAESPPAVIPEDPTPLETAFNAPGSSEIPGAPTQPAPDGASLASVFGEEPPPPPPPPPTPPGEQGAGSGEQGGVSYDEFFGGSGGDEAPPQPSESSGEGDQPDSEDDGFKDWLKGLKS